jgi:hypothetical protein
VVERGKIDLRHLISVRDESGSVVFNMHFEDAVTVRWRPNSQSGIRRATLTQSRPIGRHSWSGPAKGD